MNYCDQLDYRLPKGGPALRYLFFTLCRILDSFKIPKIKCLFCRIPPFFLGHDQKFLSKSAFNNKDNSWFILIHFAIEKCSGFYSYQTVESLRISSAKSLMWPAKTLVLLREDRS
jgi:hypothetical protein